MVGMGAMEENMNNNELKELLNKIEPTQEEKNCIQNVVDSVRNIIINNAGKLKVAEFRIGGSFEKETMIAGRNEVDIVIAISPKNGEYLYKDLANINMNFIENTFYINWYDSLIEQNGSKINRDYKKNTLTMKTLKGVSLDFLVKFKKEQLIKTSSETEFENYYLERDGIQLKFVNKANQEYPLYKNCVKLLKHFRNEEKLHELKSYMIEVMMYYALVKYLEGDDYVSYLTAFMKGLKDFTDKKVIEVSDKMYSYLGVKKTKLSSGTYFCIDVSNRSNNVGEFVNDSNIKEFRTFYNKYKNYFFQDNQQTNNQLTNTKICEIGIEWQVKDKELYVYYVNDGNKVCYDFFQNKADDKFNNVFKYVHKAINKFLTTAINKGKINKIEIDCKNAQIYKILTLNRFNSNVELNEVQKAQLKNLYSRANQHNIKIEMKGEK